MNALNDAFFYRNVPEKIGFYIAANDQEILGQVNRLMSRSGFVGMTDTAGRLHYVIDGRRGSPHAARRIIETTEKVIRDRQDKINPLIKQLSPAVERVLSAHNIRQELKGYRFLRYALLVAGLDESLLRPISKTLYPAAAAHFKVGVSHIERDIRYCLQKTDFRQLGLTSTAAVCRLYDEMIHLAEALQDKEKPSGNLLDAEGSLDHDIRPAMMNSLKLADKNACADDCGK